MFQWSTRDWVDRWASSSLPTTCLDNNVDDDDDDDDDDFEDEDLSFLSLRDPEGGRSRRRLPPTPHKGTVMNGGTEDCLQVLIHSLKIIFGL
jgi:hypothetical protein